MDENLVELADYIKVKFPETVTGTTMSFGELTLLIKPAKIVSLMRFLRDDGLCKFISIVDVCGVDYPQRQKRFDVVYHLLSPTQNLRLRLKLETDAETAVPSITEIYPGANWFEREAYDMYGILFSGHPDLRRLLTDYGFDGYPLRKDFPTSGFVETRYDEERKRVVYEPVKLAQEFRSFDYLSPWEGTDYVLPGDEKAN